MYEVNETGGAYIGHARATWPFGRLFVSKNRLQVSAGLAGMVIFEPGDVIQVVPKGSLLSIASGTIKIIHNVASYPKSIEFSYSGSSKELLARIERTGFLDKEDVQNNTLEEMPVHDIQATGSFPIKRWPAIIFVVIWNSFILIDFKHFLGNASGTSGPGLGMFAALSFLLMVSLLMIFNNTTRQLLLKPGHSFQQISASLYFIIFVACMMLIIGYAISFT